MHTHCHEHVEISQMIIKNASDIQDFGLAFTDASNKFNNYSEIIQYCEII